MRPSHLAAAVLTLANCLLQVFITIMIAITIKMIVIVIKMMPRCEFDQINKKSLLGSPGTSTQPGGQSAPGIRSTAQISEYIKEREKIYKITLKFYYLFLSSIRTLA